MLFNSLEFILVFLPVVIAGYYLLKSRHYKTLPVIWLVGASFFFYAWWRVEYLLLLLASILVNYALGNLLSSRGRTSKLILVTGIGFNLGVLGYFKYANFFLDTFNQLATNASAGMTFDSHSTLTIILPLAISFYTFQQIAYLVDCYQGKVKRYGFLYYCLFVSFFPQLIAGPIVHHREMIPQFIRSRHKQFNLENIAVGIGIFALGLFKKVIIADNLALDATPVFQKVDEGNAVTFLEAWQGALAYSLQIYFDFSGYCDMATGAARCFGIILPINFSSPYKANNIIDFWRRWHMTLSRFLRDYLYIPLGGNRKGKIRRYNNLLITMLLGGLWHGAGWNFIIWGGLHGLYLCINHSWHAIKIYLQGTPHALVVAGRKIGILLTLISVIFAWVFFRAETLTGAISMIEGMLGMHGVVIPIKYFDRWGEFSVLLVGWGVEFKQISTLSTLSSLYVILLLWPLVRMMPNVFSMMSDFNPVIGENDPSRFKIRLNKWSGIFIGIVLILALQSLNRVSEFLYFQF